MSVLEQTRQTAARPSASIAQIVVCTLVSMGAMFTAHLSVLTAYVDVFAGPGSAGQQRFDELGRPFTGFSQVWHAYGSLLWAVYGLALVVTVVVMWRTVLRRATGAAWSIVPGLLVATSAFWVLSYSRFSF